MRVALVVVALLGCSKHAAESPAASTGAGEPAMAPAPPPPPPAGGSDQARDEARASGVLGPTEGSAFEEPAVQIKSASSDAIHKLANDRLDPLSRCYDRALEKGRVSGELAVSIQDGKVRLDRTTITDRKLVNCVLAELRAASLPKDHTKHSLVLAFQR